MDLTKVKENIRAMLNLANNDAATEGEVANAMRFAAKLMEQHQLTEEDVKESKVEEKLLNLERAAMGQSSSFTHGSETLKDWLSNAAHFACAFVGGVKWYYSDHQPYVKNGIRQLSPRAGKPLYRTKITFYGIAEDVEIAQQVYDELCMTIITMGRLRYGVVYRGAGVDYCEGFMSGIWDKWYKDQDSQLKLAKAAEAKQPGTALMVIDSRKAIVERKKQLTEAWAKENLGLGKGRARRARSNYDGDANAAGRADGAKYTATKQTRKKLT